MPQTQEVIREQQAGVTPGGKKVTRVKTEVSSPEVEEKITIWTANRFIYYVFGVIETLLVFRFTLKVLGANPASPFVSFIYALSGFFIAPFRGIFNSAVFQGIEQTASVLEPSTLFAIIVYLVLALGITELVNVLTASDME